MLLQFQDNFTFAMSPYHNSIYWQRSCDRLHHSIKLPNRALICCFQGQGLHLILSDDQWTIRSLICFPPSRHAVLVLRPQMALFATPELGLTPLICAHIKILRFLFKLRQLDTSSPPCVVHSALQGCTTPPPRNALAAVYHWLYWEHLMARSWWILWAVDLLITVPG